MARQSSRTLEQPKHTERRTMSQTPLRASSVTTSRGWIRPLEGRAKMDGEVEGTVGNLYRHPSGDSKLQILLTKGGFAWIEGEKVFEENVHGLTLSQGDPVAVTLRREDGMNFVTEFRALLKGEHV